jgi:hypothetical protein
MKNPTTPSIVPLKMDQNHRNTPKYTKIHIFPQTAIRDAYPHTNTHKLTQYSHKYTHIHTNWHNIHTNWHNIHTNTHIFTQFDTELTQNWHIFTLGRVSPHIDTGTRIPTYWHWDAYPHIYTLGRVSTHHPNPPTPPPATYLNK